MHFQNGNNGEQKQQDGKETCTRTPGTPNSLFSQPIPSPAFSHHNVPSPAYPSLMSPFHSHTIPPSNNHQYNQPFPGYSVPPSPCHSIPYNQVQNYGSSSASSSTAPNGGAVNSYLQQQHQQAASNMYSGGHQQYPNGYHGQQYMTQQNHTFSQQVMGLQGHGSLNHQRFNSNSGMYGFHPSMTPYGFATDAYGPVHICGHLAAPNLPSVAYQSPCNACQNNGSTINIPPSHYQASSWQIGLSNGFLNYSSFCNNQSGTSYPESVPQCTNGDASSMIYQPPSDVQCRDVSQSSQSRPKSQSNPVNDNGEKSPSSKLSAVTPAKSNNANTTPIAEGDSSAKEKLRQPKNEVTKQEDSKPLTETKPIPTKTENKPAIPSDTHFMKTDTYQRTLQYVQQCQSWNNSSVKEEVSSSTDHKPEIDSKGTVLGYTIPNTAVGPSNLPVTQPPSTQPQSIQSRFNMPLPPPIQETPNMVINDLTSSLTSLQEENKYLQMLQ